MCKHRFSPSVSYIKKSLQGLRIKRPSICFMVSWSWIIVFLWDIMLTVRCRKIITFWQNTKSHNLKNAAAGNCLEVEECDWECFDTGLYINNCTTWTLKCIKAAHKRLLNSFFFTNIQKLTCVKNFPWPWQQSVFLNPFRIKTSKVSSQSADCEATPSRLYTNNSLPINQINISFVWLSCSAFHPFHGNWSK